MRRALVITLFTFLILPLSVIAQEAQLELGKENSIAENLTKLTGKNVIIRTTGGGEISGTVSKVGEDAVIITSVTGKEFYDAVIRLDSIDLVMARARK